MTVGTQSSPRAWGCFLFTGSSEHLIQVFPTCVGVFLRLCGDALLRYSLPHVRGGVSEVLMHHRIASVSSPRAWGCFQKAEEKARRQLVFPTCVGVFL